MKWFFAAAAILFCLLSPNPSYAEIDVPVTEFTLDNGLHVILHQDHRVPLVVTNIWYFVGSSHEKPGRTGFAHLFEHLLFEGSRNVQEGEFDTLLEEAGGDNNGSTNTDRTNYWITLPANSLELALFLESDRMGFLLDAMSPEVVDGQREVVKNERRQSYENRPYGVADLRLSELLYPPGHPYHWPVIGYMEDLNAADYDDVVEFFQTFYAPGNASLVIAGDIDVEKTRALVEHWFSDIPSRAVPPKLQVEARSRLLPETLRETLEDDVSLGKLTLAWHSPPRFAEGDAELDLLADILTSGMNSRLYQKLVYELQLAQDVSALQRSAALGSVFLIEVLPKPGQSLEELRLLIDRELELLGTEAPSQRELDRALNSLESGFLSAMESLSWKANSLNSYYMATGQANFYANDLARYRSLTPERIQNAVNTYLLQAPRVELTVVPKEQQ